MKTIANTIDGRLHERNIALIDGVENEPTKAPARAKMVSTTTTPVSRSRKFSSADR